MHPCISSLDIYAHPFNHRFFERGSDSGVISAYLQGSQPDSSTFLPFNFDFTTGTLSQLEDEANPEVGMEVFGIAEEIALAVFEGSDDLFEDDINPDVRSREAVELKQESLPTLATSTNLPSPPATCSSCSPVTLPIPCHHLHQDSESQHTCSSDNKVSPTNPMTYAQVACTSDPSESETAE